MRRRGLTSVLAVGVLLVVGGQPARAVDPIPGVPIPEEEPAALLTERGTTAVPFDLDGDDVRELVVVTADADRPGFAAVQAFWVDGGGGVTASNDVDLRRSATFDDRVAIGNGARIDEEGMTAVRLTEPARLVTAQRDGRPVLLAATIESNPELTAPCCVTIWEVRSAGPGEITLTPAVETHEYGAQLATGDLDADGTDELVVIESDPSDGDRSETVTIFRWDGKRYARLGTLAVDGLEFGAPVLDVGETDGVPGEEVLLGGQDLEGLALLRLTVRGGKPTLETTRVDFLAAARALPLTSRPTLFVTDGGGTTFHASWGRDEAIAWTPTRPLPGEPLAVIGSGASARILLGSWPTPRTIQVVSGDLRDAEEPLEFFADFRTVAFDSLAQGDPPSSAFAGPVPGGLDGGVDAYVFGGQVLIAPSSPDAPPERASIATLPGLAIAGTVGPSAGWMGLAPAAGIPGGEFLFQFASIGPSPRVTDLVALGQPGSISLVRTADVLEPERDVGMLRPTFRGVAPDPTRAMTLLVGNEAVDADIVGPPGTAIRWIARPASNPGVPGENESHAATIGPGGVARLRLLEAAIPEDPDLHEAVISIWLVTPAGHAYRGTWVVQVYRQPPDLGMEDEVPLLDFAPTVTGRTAPGSTVTVNGVSAEVDPDGSFSVPVDVGVVPTELRIVATDLVGNRTERVVTRVWPLDYRQLPFVPIAVLLTIAAAVVLFVRRPASGPGTRRTPDDGSTFEEIGG